ncbi:MAG: hypothetical protein HN726_04670 [Candidatus Magasanikbacteria bacterium]|jgi:hypothetical protein|nr:hypothetical protein [Candidatus Magasanikbacteria bacterium]
MKTTARERLNSELKSYRERMKANHSVKGFATMIKRDAAMNFFGLYSSKDEMNASFDAYPFECLKACGDDYEQADFFNDAMSKVQKKRERFAKAASEQFAFANTINEVANDTPEPSEFLSRLKKKKRDFSSFKVTDDAA